MTVHISALRKALSERKGENRFLPTVPGKGYKFIGELKREPENAEIIIENHKIERFTIDEKLPDLKVMSRNSVFHYKGKGADAKIIGAELNVQAVLNGRVVQRGDILNVRTELISTADNSVIWGE